LKWLAWTIGSLVATALALIVAVIAVFLFRPEWFGTPKIVNWVGDQARKAALDAGLELSWDDLKLELSSAAPLSKRVMIELIAPCVREGRNHACFSRIAISSEISFTHLLPRIGSLGPIDIEGGHGAWKFAAGKNSETSPSHGGGLPKVLRLMLGGTAFQPVNVDVRSADITLADGSRYRGKVLVRGVSPKKENARLEIAVQAQAIAGPLKGILPQAELKQCFLNVAPGPGQGFHVDLACPVRARLRLPPPEGFPALKLPEWFGATVRAQLESSEFPPTGDSRVRGSFEVGLGDFHTVLFSAHGTANMPIDATLSEVLSKAGHTQADVDLALEIPRMHKLARDLMRTRYTVPAPFHVLRGRADLSVRGKAGFESAYVKVSLSTRLASLKQHLDLDVDGTLQAEGLGSRSVIRTQADLLLTRVTLQLPTLDFSAPPQILPDPRLKAAPPEHERAGITPPLEFHYRVHVHTAPYQPVTLLSNLAKAPIPINIDSIIDSEKKITGGVRVTSFPVEVFRRKATVDHFSVNLREPLDESVIDGKIVVEYTDYIITVSMLSTAGKPVISLASDPPLPEDAVWAALLFGAPLDELDPEQTGSVGSAQVAAASGAMSLLSLYALASTPIENVNYDTKTGTLSMRVRLAEGTSVTLGEESGQLASIGIKKRLGGRWSLETDVTRQTETSGQVASAYLQWGMRY
jgi:hypothetical protein